MGKNEWFVLFENIIGVVKYLISSPTIAVLVGGIVTAIFGYLASRSEGQRTPKGIAIGALVGGLIVLFAGIYSAYDQYLVEQLLLNKTQEIASLSKEIASLSKKNAGLSIKIVNLTEKNMIANKRIQDTLIGGDSYCNIEHAFPVETNNTIERFLINKGEYPMYEVSIDITDLNKLSKLDFSSPSISVDEINQAKEKIFIGTLGAHRAVVLPVIHTSQEANKQDYNIFINARNGSWTQNVRLRRIDGRWKLATKISQGKTVLYKSISNKFPISELDWD